MPHHSAAMRQKLALLQVMQQPGLSADDARYYLAELVKLEATQLGRPSKQEVRLNSLRKRVARQRQYRFSFLGTDMAAPLEKPCAEPLEKDERVTNPYYPKELSRLESHVAAVIGPRLGAPYMLKLCSTPDCSEPTHYFWGTGQDSAKLKFVKSGKYASRLSSLEAKLEELEATCVGK